MPKDVLVSTENLTTLVVVVSKASRAEFLACYESLTDLIVPRSAVQIAEDNDYVAFSVVLFRRVVDEFKASARTKGFQAKDVAGASLEAFASSEREKELDGGISEDENANGLRREAGNELSKLKEDAEMKRSALVQWCLVSYGEAFSSWIHVTAVRLFVESILRYGLPPQFLPVLVHPYPRHQGTVRKILATHFGGIGGHHFTLESSGGGGANEELFPYVSFTLNVEEQ